MSQHDPFAPLDGNQAGVAPATPSSLASNQAPVPNESEVPRGTRMEIVAWVGNDKGKARKALSAELATGEPRKSLVAHLKDVIRK